MMEQIKSNNDWNRIHAAFWFLAGVGVGAIASYYYDPDLGRHRRAFLREKRRRMQGDWLRQLDRQVRDLNSYLEGWTGGLSKYLPENTSSTFTRH